MIISHLTLRADEAHRRYLAFIDRMRGLYHRALTSRDFGTVAAANRIDKEIEDASVWYLHEEWDAALAVSQEIAQIARTATLQEIASIESIELTDEAIEHVSASCEYLYSEILAQVSRDSMTLKRELRRVNLEVTISARSRGTSTRSAVMEYLIGNTSDIEFTFHDRASRKWRSSAFIRSTWRQTLLSIYNEVVLFALAEHGLRTATIVNQSPDAAHHGMVIAMSSGSELPTYSEIRESAFHPNANAYLKMTEKADV